MPRQALIAKVELQTACQRGLLPAVPDLQALGTAAGTGTGACLARKRQLIGRLDRPVDAQRAASRRLGARKKDPLDSSSHPSNSAMVLIPGPLRSRVGNQASLRVAGRTVGELIEALDRDFPGLKFSLCDEQGELREYVNVYVGGQEVRFLAGLETEVESDQAVQILMSIAGGS